MKPQNIHQRDLKFEDRTGAASSKDPWRRFQAGMGLLTLVLGLGAAGYTAIGLEPLDALYQTVITISTVGYREIGEVGGGYQIFTIFLILFGAGTALYTLGVLIETMFEGRLDGKFRRRRMQQQINRLNGHTILCGYGRVGQAVAGEIRKSGEEIVVVDRRPPDRLDERLVIVGDATDDDVLLRAGIKRAKTLVLAMDSDVDNLFVTLTARSINAGLFIVVRANEPASESKLRQAGADRMVNPHLIGGVRMAALVSNPGSAEFLDVVMQDEGFEVRLADFDVAEGSPFAGCSLADIRIRSITGANVLAVRRGGSYTTNPPPRFVLEPGDLFIALGAEEQLEALRDLSDR